MVRPKALKVERLRSTSCSCSAKRRHRDIQRLLQPAAEMGNAKVNGNTPPRHLAQPFRLMLEPTTMTTNHTYASTTNVILVIVLTAYQWRHQWMKSPYWRLTVQDQLESCRQASWRSIFGICFAWIRLILASLMQTFVALELNLMTSICRPQQPAGDHDL